MDIIENPSLFESVHVKIRDAICDGTLKPNERLNQDKIAEDLNVSRQPVNQALLLLKAQGFVIDAGRRGVMVAPIDTNLVANIYDIRLALDPVAARLATAHVWTKEEIESGRRLLAAGQQALVAGSERDLVQADFAFHRYLYQLSGNNLLCDVLDLHFDHLRRAMQAVLYAGPAHHHFWDEHQAMFEAILAGDSVRAAELSGRHLRNAAEIVRDALLNAERDAGPHESVENNDGIQ